MHGAGNDYIYINALEHCPADAEGLAREISNRHFGIGSDGLVLILPSERADFRMRMFNADGSEAEMCGHASRCVGKFVYESGLTDRTELSRETGAGIRHLSLDVKDGVVKSVKVDMGEPGLVPGRIPVNSTSEEAMVSESATVGGINYQITAVSMGNPHAVIFNNPLSDALVLGHGPELEVAPLFPNRTNVEFVQVISRDHIKMRVWERGSGETLACGTGACAAVVASVLNGLTDRKVNVSLPGGELLVEWNEEDNHVYLSGPAEVIACGVYYRQNLSAGNEESENQ